MGILFRLLRVTLWIIWEINPIWVSFASLLRRPRLRPSWSLFRPAHGGRAGDACKFYTLTPEGFVQVDED